ncbi:MAG: VOC family protein [Bacteroidales bacterium]|nr:VOC family protein [Bacteroidales bacterium]
MNKSMYPCIWSNHNARVMADFYVSAFPNARVVDENQAVVVFTVNDQRIMLLNGGEMFNPTPTISLMYLSSDEKEVEEIYRKLSDGGKDLMPLDSYGFSKKYAWVEDRFGMTWQLYTGNEKDIAQKIVPTLMFVDKNNGKAEEAVNFYMSIFPASGEARFSRYTGEEGETLGNIQHGQFVVNNYMMMIMDSSYPHSFNFNEGVSLVVECNTQEEIDLYWERLIADGGEEGMCGWLKDRFGVSWQVVPAVIDKLMQRSPKVLEMMMNMGKLDIQKLREAAEG